MFCKKGVAYGGFSCLTEGVCSHRPSGENYHCAQSQPVILVQITGRRVAALGSLKQTDLGYLTRKPDKINDLGCNDSAFENVAASSRSCSIWFKHLYSFFNLNQISWCESDKTAAAPGKPLLATLLDCEPRVGDLVTLVLDILHLSYAV